MNIIHICICSGGKKTFHYTPNSPGIVQNKTKRSFSLNILLNQQYGKLKQKKKFVFVSTIFRLVGSSNLGLDYFQIFEYI